jgi:chemotaxis protein MotA
MAVDGMDAATIEHVMRSEMEATDLRHTYGKGVLETMGRFSPVFGMIGTLIGLVVMLGHMTDPSRIGPGMAVALLTTLYGLLIANVFCLPLARKLAGRSSDELMVKQMMLKGVLAIQAGDHPRIVEQKLRAYIPGSERERRRTDEKVASLRQDAGRKGASPAGGEIASSQLPVETAAKAEIAGQREAA